MRLTIFHTNDMHGRLEAMARLSTFARGLCAEASAAGRQAFFWDAGDAADRAVRLCRATRGAAFGPILNAMGYTLQTMGNAIALTYGPQALAAVARRCAFPILAANCRDGDGPLVEGLHETATILLPHGRVLGVVGLTAHFDGLYELFGLNFPDFLLVARRLVDELRRKGAAPVIVLSHLGLPDDRRLAEAVPGIDVIIGGHTHDRLPAGEEVNGVLIAQAGEYGQAIGRIDLEIDDSDGRVLARQAQVLEVPPSAAPDAAVVEATRVAEQEAEALLSQPLGELSQPLNLNYFAECALGNMAADALRERTGAEVAIVASGQFHAALPAGRLTLGQLDAACFSTGNPGVSQISGRQLLSGFERGLDPAVQHQVPRALRGTPVGLPQISGAVIEYNPTLAPGQRVRQVRLNGQVLDPDATYRVAHTDAETLAEVGFVPAELDLPTVYELPTILPDVLQDYISRHSPVAAPEPGRWCAGG